jgi:hypothetical protein
VGAVAHQPVVGEGLALLEAAHQGPRRRGRRGRWRSPPLRTRRPSRPPGGLAVQLGQLRLCPTSLLPFPHRRPPDARTGPTGHRDGAPPPCAFEPIEFLAGGNTVYIVAPSDAQIDAAPLIVGLVEEIRTAARYVSGQLGGELPIPLLLALDEVYAGASLISARSRSSATVSGRPATWRKGSPYRTDGAARRSSWTGRSRYPQSGARASVVSWASSARRRTRAVLPGRNGPRGDRGGSTSSRRPSRSEPSERGRHVPS